MPEAFRCDVQWVVTREASRPSMRFAPEGDDAARSDARRLRLRERARYRAIELSPLESRS